MSSVSPFVGKRRRSSESTKRSALRSVAEEDQRVRVLFLDFLKVLTFYATGIVFFKFSEEPSWGTLKSLYFISVSIFTIGYGDVVPYSAAGRFFSMAYVLVGIAVIFPIMARLGGYLLKGAEHSFLNRLLKDSQEDALRHHQQGDGQQKGGTTTTTAPQRGSSSEVSHSNPLLQMRRHRVRFIFSFALISFPLSLGSVVLWVLNRSGETVSSRNRSSVEEKTSKVAWTVLDSVWYSYCTLTTIGYGDLKPHNTERHRTFLLVFMPCSVIIGAAAISNIASILREIREEHKQKSMLDHMDYDMLKAMDQNDDGVDKNEFVLAMIKALNLVEPQKITRLENVFDDADVDGSGKLDKHDIEAIALARSTSPQKNKKITFYEARLMALSNFTNRGNNTMQLEETTEEEDLTPTREATCPPSEDDCAISMEEPPRPPDIILPHHRQPPPAPTPTTCPTFTCFNTS